MASLLDIFGTTPEQTQAMGLLGAGLMSGNPAAAFANASGFLSGADERKLRRSLLEAQVAETLAQADERKTLAAQRQAEAARQAGIQAGLPGLFQRPGLTGGEARPQTFSGTDVPMFSAPMGVAPMRATPGGFDMQRALTELRMKPEEAKAYAEAAQFGRPKVARTVEVMRNGKPTLIQLDDSGQEIGAGYDQWKAPVMQGLGDRVAAIDPVSLQPRGSFPMGQSPDSKASTAVSWANYGLNKDRLNMERGNMVAESGGPTQVGLTKQFGKASPGYRWKADGTQEAIPGGPADIKAGELGAKADARSKSAVAQADSVLKEIGDAKGLVGWNTAGVGGALSVLPATDARDLGAKLTTIKANLGFDRLQQMRDQSPTGGALGQVAVQELASLQATVASLDQMQSPTQLGKALDKIEKHYTNWRNVVQQAASPQGGATGSWGIQKVN